MNRDAIRINFMREKESSLNRVVFHIGKVHLNDKSHATIDENLSRVIVRCHDIGSITFGLAGDLDGLIHHFKANAPAAVIRMSSKAEHAVKLVGLRVFVKEPCCMGPCVDEKQDSSNAFREALSVLINGSLELFMASVLESKLPMSKHIYMYTIRLFNKPLNANRKAYSDHFISFWVHSHDTRSIHNAHFDDLR